jgi:hypothetical protein
MATTIDSQSTAPAVVTSSNNTVNSLTFAFNNVAGTLLVVNVATGNPNDGGTLTVTGVTYNGVALTKAVSKGHDLIGGTPGHSETSQWWLLAPATGSHNVVVTVTNHLGGSNVGTILAGAVSFVGHDPTTPIGVVASNAEDGAATTTARTTLTGTTAGNFLLNAVGVGGATGTPSQTQLWLDNDNGGSASGNFGSSYVTASPGGSVNFDWTVPSGEFWGGTAIEILVAPAGTTGTSRRSATAAANIVATSRRSTTVSAHATGPVTDVARRSTTAAPNQPGGDPTLDSGFPVAATQLGINNLLSIASPAITTPGPNRLIVVQCQWAGGPSVDPAPLSISGGGLTWKLLREEHFGVTGSSSAAIWCADAPTALTAQVITVTRAGSQAATQSAQIAVYSYTNCAQSSLQPGVTGGNAQAGTPGARSVSLVGCQAKSVLHWSAVDGGSSGGNALTLTANLTKDFELLDTTNANSLVASHSAPLVSAGNQTVGVTGTDTFTAHVGVEILKAPASDQTATVRRSTTASPAGANVTRRSSTAAPWGRDVTRRSTKVTPRALGPFPVSYSANSRYLVDVNGKPFPILGRTAWFITSLTQTDITSFLDDTQAKGFNAIEFHVVNHDSRGNNPPFGNGGANLPFLKDLTGATYTGALPGNTTGAPDFTQPNEPYWANVDAMMAAAEARGIVCLMFPAYCGFNGGSQGWMQEMRANGSVKMQTYGAWLATRYQNRKNIVWMIGGDYAGFSNPGEQAAEQGLIDGLKSVAGQQSLLFSAEWASESTSHAGQGTFGTNCTLNGSYSFNGDVNNIGRQAYSDAVVQPAFLLEEPYDQEGPDGNGANNTFATQPVRRFEWWGWLSTIGGYVAGNGFVWQFNPGVWNLPAHLNSTGAQNLAKFNTFINSLEWWKLVPSGLAGMGTLITAGGGAGVSAADYVAASADPAGSLLIAYVPPAHAGSITVDMTKMAASCRARWFDPTSGSYTAIGTFANTGTQAFTTPAANSAGEHDFALVLDVVTTSLRSTTAQAQASAVARRATTATANTPTATTRRSTTVNGRATATSRRASTATANTPGTIVGTSRRSTTASPRATGVTRRSTTATPSQAVIEQTARRATRADATFAAKGLRSTTATTQAQVTKRRSTSVQPFGGRALTFDAELVADGIDRELVVLAVEPTLTTDGDSNLV